jgi:hypothetical protein
MRKKSYWLANAGQFTTVWPITTHIEITVAISISELAVLRIN